jgi:CRP/FNR family cyclic AMP-dependent transcriptional regulator
MGSTDAEVLSRRIAFLQNVSLFTKLNEKDLAKIVKDFRVKSYDRDETIFRQRDNSYEFYIVLDGKVRIFRISPSGGETSINIFTTYDIFGEFATLDNLPRSATAKAIVPTNLLQMSQDRFLYHMRTIPQLALSMSELLAEKLRWTAAYAEAIAQYDAAGRLLHILLLYNEQFGTEIEAGQRYILDLALNQTDLASLVGARREWVNRILRDWQKRGLIEYDAGKIIILDLPRVQQERDSRIEGNGPQW